MSEGVFRPRGHDISEHASAHASYLDSLEEAVNRQIDTDVKALMDNFKEIINLSRVRESTPRRTNLYRLAEKITTI